MFLKFHGVRADTRKDSIIICHMRVLKKEEVDTQNIVITETTGLIFVDSNMVGILPLSESLNKDRERERAI